MFSLILTGSAALAAIWGLIEYKSNNAQRAQRAANIIIVLGLIALATHIAAVAFLALYTAGIVR